MLETKEQVAPVLPVPPRRNGHFSSAYRPVEELDEFCQQLHKRIRLEPNYTDPLHKRVIAEFGCTKSRFDTALKKL